MTEELNKRVVDLINDLFNAAAAQAADADTITDMVRGEVEDLIDDRVADALTERIGCDEIVTCDSFNDYLSDSDVLSAFVEEEYVDDAIRYAVNDLDHTFVSRDEMQQMLLDLEASIRGVPLRTRIKALFTLTKQRLLSLASYRISFRKA